MVLRGVCIVTRDVPHLRDFYENVLGVSPGGDDAFACFHTDGADLSIYSIEVTESLSPGVMKGAGAGKCFLEFEVQDPDVEYERLSSLGVEICKPPTTQPWGVRSFWFRDPEGNVVIFYAPIEVQDDNMAAT